MYTVTESTKRNDEYFDFVKELDSIKGRRPNCSGGCKIYSGGGRTAAPPLNTPLLGRDGRNYNRMTLMSVSQRSYSI